MHRLRMIIICEFSKAVWRRVKLMGDFNDAPDDWHYVEGQGNFKSIWSIIRKLVLAVVVYLICQERNNRIFTDKKRSVQMLGDQVREVVRLRLMGLTYKKSENVLRAAEVWKFKVEGSVYSKRRIEIIWLLGNGLGVGFC
ncbi:hypothetical protein Hdeb2414_s0140g00810781 [Helianthus debilis subsp. tardiflorus]